MTLLASTTLTGSANGAAIPINTVSMLDAIVSVSATSGTITAFKVWIEGERRGVERLDGLRRQPFGRAGAPVVDRAVEADPVQRRPRARDADRDDPVGDARRAGVREVRPR
jgi:hypothetical protein